MSIAFASRAAPLPSDLSATFEDEGARDVIDLDAPEMRVDPYPTYARLRARDGLYRAGENLWLVARAADVHRALMDPSTYSSALLGNRSIPYLIALDPPEHTRLRAMVARAFTAPSIAALAPRIEALADDLLDRAITRQGAGQGVELVEAFANPLPATVIGHLLGVPTERHDDLRRWSEASLRAGGGIVDPLGTDASPTAKADALALMRYLAGLIERYAREPADNLISALVAVHQEGDMTGTELVFFCQLLLIAGHMTTQHLIGNGTWLLATRPDLWRRLQDDPGLVPRFVEETLRYESPLQARLRVTTRETTLGGTALPKGALVLLLLGSANRDGCRFVDGDTFDIDRSQPGHVALGHGIHGCLGGALARLEASIAFQRMLHRLDRLALVDRPDGAQRIEDAVGLAWRGFERLHVHLVPRVTP